MIAWIVNVMKAWIGNVWLPACLLSVNVYDDADFIHWASRSPPNSVSMLQVIALHRTQAGRLNPQVPHPSHRQHVHLFMICMFECRACSSDMFLDGIMFYKNVCEHVFSWGSCLRLAFMNKVYDWYPGLYDSINEHVYASDMINV